MSDPSRTPVYEVGDELTPGPAAPGDPHLHPAGVTPQGQLPSAQPTRRHSEEGGRPGHSSERYGSEGRLAGLPPASPSSSSAQHHPQPPRLEEQVSNDSGLHFRRNESAPTQFAKAYPNSPNTYGRLSSGSGYVVSNGGGVRRSSGMAGEEIVQSSKGISFQKGRVVGSGGFGTVYQAVLSTGALAAVKELKIDNSSFKTIDREVHIMSSLPPHDNCVHYFGSRSTSRRYYIIMEFISGGSIHSLRKSVGPFREAVFQRYAYMTLLGLDHLHRHGIIHRDIKGANVLLDEKGVAKIVDFGCCRDLNQTTTSITAGGTPLWMAPEVCRGEQANEKSDVWSFGCLCLEMTNDTGLPWNFPQSMSMQGLVYALACAKQPPPIPSHLTEAAQDFIASCLRLDPAERLSVPELVEHPFFDQDYYDESDDDELMATRRSANKSAVKRMAVNGDIYRDPMKGLDSGDFMVQQLNTSDKPAHTSNKTTNGAGRPMESMNAGFHLAAVDDDDEGVDKSSASPLLSPPHGREAPAAESAASPPPRPPQRPQREEPAAALADDYEAQLGDIVALACASKVNRQRARVAVAVAPKSNAVRYEDSDSDSTSLDDDESVEGSSAAGSETLLASADRNTPEWQIPGRPAEASAIASRVNCAMLIAKGIDKALNDVDPAVVKPSRRASATPPKATAAAPAAAVPAREPHKFERSEDTKGNAEGALTETTDDSTGVEAAAPAAQEKPAEPEEYVWRTEGHGSVEKHHISLSAAQEELEDIERLRKRLSLTSVEVRRPSATGNAGHPKRSGLSKLLRKK